MSRDHQRGKVYSAEQQLRQIYDFGGSTFLMEGITLQLEPEAKFDTLDQVQAYVDRVTVHPGVIALTGITGRVTVRPRKGTRFAHYERRNRAIAVADHGSKWALRELVLLHELAHHYSPAFGDGSHGPKFVSTFTNLVEIVIGPQAALALRLLNQGEGVRAA